MAAPTQFAYRTLKGIGVVDASPVYEPLSGFQRPDGNLRCCVYSPDGRYFAWASPERVTVVDASVGHVITSLAAQNVYELGFSPLGTFIITWQRPGKDDNGDAVKNLKVWRVLEGGPDAGEEEHNVVGRFVQKSQTGWNLQYTYDEQYCARVVTNEVQFYQSADLGTVWNKLRVEGVTDFAVSPGKNHSIAVFIPERKGLPAAVKVFTVPNFDAAVSQKNFFKGDKVQLKWNDEGTSLIVLAQTEVDKSGKTYDGEATLYLLSANGGFDSRIDLDKKGPIYDVTWSPNSKEFGVVYGYIPAKTTIFNVRAVATHSFALAPRNTILFSPRGRFVLVAGFGTLVGQMDIYDLEKNYNKICTIEASNASVCEWSPDGKHILTAITSPRLRVDNGVRIWHVGGGLMYNEEFQELYHVCWRPQSTLIHPVANPLSPVPTPHASALAYLGTVKTPSKPAGAYRPPGARGTLTPLAFKREDEGGAAYISNGSLSLGSGVNGFGKPRKREVPGAEAASEDQAAGAAPGATPTGAADGDENLSKTALRNKKKREAKKAKEAADKEAGLAPTADSAGTAPLTGTAEGRSPERRDRRGHARSRSKSTTEPRPHSPHRRPITRSQTGATTTTPARHSPSNGTPRPSAPTPSSAASVAAPPDTPDLTLISPGGAQDKKIRALLKKLRAIDDLKMRRAGGEKLEGTQIRKMETEEGVRRELEGLGWRD
ncbi:Translation initiation factor, beta propellor-like domain [Lasallia pustulata]|uniref:Eukaryotic translation initiation factor 2A n=1 Tax=Lasallia pustulata TaxID=136370 RepID=A0A1W5D0L8_9LECA|nr:Translation initiation factor, beta propellor-like domain [Lasallia pustulata]